MLAGPAVVEGLTVDQADIIAVRRGGETECFANNCELASLSRMKELDVKCGVTRHE